jgi:tRNA1Val (adenine37-N6)-methyltransferase
MPNPYFQFKQFTIHQDKCAMKICTDACILGAWFAGKSFSPKNILDIGSGTGLLMLMLAQKHNGNIQGIEIDLASLGQLKENIANSGWRQRLVIHKGDIRTFTPDIKFDFIISNPPFYENNLETESAAKNIARHSKQLTLEDLLKAIDRNLTNRGSFGLLLPHGRLNYFEKIAAEKGFHLVERLLLRQSPSHNYFRGILHFAKEEEKKIAERELTIQDQTGEYTREFIKLLKDFYLYLHHD